MFGSSQWMYSSGGAFYGTEIDGSLRFNDDDSAYLTKTFASAGNREKWTLSFWIKRTSLGSNDQIFYAHGGSSNLIALAFNTPDTLYMDIGGVGRMFETNAVYRDVSAWYHIVVAFNTTDYSTVSAGQVKVYVNGVEQTFSSTTNMTQGFDGAINDAVDHTFGRDEGADNNYADYYLAEVNFIDGQQLDATSFGETKSGVWIPKAYSGSYGTNGFHLEFAGNANDSSGNGNNWTANNISSYDYVPDSPTNNFATWNPLASSSISSTQGNLRATTASAGSSVLSSIATPTSGKWYAEFICTAKSSSGVNIGVTPSEGAAMTESFTEFSNVSGTNGYGWYNDLGRIYYGNGVYDSYDTTYAVGDIIGVALDVDNGTVIWSKNGTAQSTYTRPSAGISYYFAAGEGQGSATATIAANFGQDSTFQGYTTAGGNSDGNGYGDFKYSVPSGYLALCTANLTVAEAVDPALDNSPADYFSTTLYSGNGSTQSITGVGFQPDFVWVKSRSNTQYHSLSDSVRGTDKVIFTNAAIDEEPDGVTSFDSDGFSLDSWGGMNQSGQTFAAWSWKAGTSVSGSTGGSGTSKSYTGSVNTDVGFSMIGYQGNGTAGHTIPHHLNNAPEFVWVKNRDANVSWNCYHTGTGAAEKLELDTSNGQLSTSAWNSTAPTSSVLTLGTNTEVNANNQNFIAYFFHSVEGYCSVGKYLGNSSSDGPFAYTGFRPAMIIIKDRSTNSEAWILQDSDRSPFNPVDDSVYPNLDNSEATGETFRVQDFVSNGFKIRASHSAINASGRTYVYIAFAENPFKYANAR